MLSRLRRKYQRQLNKKMRSLNKGIEEDKLWKGRFVFYQKSARWEVFDDKSGGVLHVIVRAYDKKTDYYKDYCLEFAPWLATFNWRLAMECANDFIVEALDVWHLEPELRTITTKDYTKVKVNISELMRRTANYYIKYEYFF